MKPVLSYEDYRLYLRDVLVAKTQSNPLFSLRAMARLLSISPSHLSRTLNGHKRLSSVIARKVSVILDHSAEEADHFASLVELETVKDQQQRTMLMKRISRGGRPGRRPVALDVFRTISDWHHFAILALTKTRGFKADAFWVGRRLAISPSEARVALDRLFALGLLEKTDNGCRASDDGEVLAGGDDTVSLAVQENHSQHLDLAKTALQRLQPTEREFNNLTISMNVANLPRAKEKLRRFVEKFNDEMEVDNGAEIYQLNLQFYQLSRSGE